MIGQTIRIGGTPHVIVGVMPAGFLFPVNHSYWVPLRTNAARYRRGQGPAIFIYGRLAAGATMADAQAELRTIGERTAAAFPDTHARLRAQVLPYAYPVLDIQDVSMWQVAVMQAIVSLLLLVVAINVAVLVYARTATRQGEIAVRTAMGASRLRIVGQLFVEALVLAGVSAAVGLGIARFGLQQGHLIIQLESTRPAYWIDYGLPPAAVAFAAGLALLAARHDVDGPHRRASRICRRDAADRDRAGVERSAMGDHAAGVCRRAIPRGLVGRRSGAAAGRGPGRVPQRARDAIPEGGVGADRAARVGIVGLGPHDRDATAGPGKYRADPDRRPVVRPVARGAGGARQRGGHRFLRRVRCAAGHGSRVQRG